MEILSFNTDFANPTNMDKDILSAFKIELGKKATIHQGMSAKEISEIVSDRIIAVVNEQFQTTKERFQSTQKD